MDRFCYGSQFWNTSLTWDGDFPEFTECFMNTVLIWIASGWLWITSPFYLRYLLSEESNPNPVTKRFITKLVIAFILLILCIVEVTTGLTDLSKTGQFWKAYLVGPSIETLTMILVIAYIFLERKKGFVTSGILFIYWTIAFITYIIPFYTKIIIKEYNTKISHFVVFNIYFVLTFIQWILYCIADTPSHPPVQGECPELRASFASRITYWWINGLVIAGYKTPLTEKNIFKLNPRDMSQTVIQKFEAIWKKEEMEIKKRSQNTRVLPINEPDPINQGDASEITPLLQVLKEDKKLKPARQKPSLLKVLAKTFGWQLLHIQIYKLFNDAMVFAYPLLLQLLIKYVQEHQNQDKGIITDNSLKQKWKGYLLAAALFVSVLLQSLFLHQMYQLGQTLGLRVRASLISIIYKKALTVGNQATKESTVGQIINLMSGDAEHLQGFIPYMWMIWSSPLQIVVSLYFLYKVVGYSVFAALGVFVFLIPLNAFIMAMATKVYEQVMVQKDKRLKLLNEILNGIKILKLYAWEMSFKEKIQAIRNVELKLLWKTKLAGFGFTFSWMVAPYLVTLVTFTIYIYTSESHYLDAGTAFVAIALFNILKFAINVAPMFLTALITARVSLNRIQKFLDHDDIDTSNVTHDPYEDDVITIKNGTFLWDSDIGPCLKNIDVSIPEGSLVAVVGQVGSGKSSLLSAVLGEMVKLKGHVNVRGSVAYVPQQAWIQNATLQSNILFGKMMKKEQYERVIEACALKPDLDILPAGDITEIGEKGINLSGGQKQRISLARAVYYDSDVYYMDDPLSAVDSHVGKHIFEEVIGNSGILKRKTRILVTHGLQWLPKVDKIIVMVDGCISEIGSYDQLLDHNGAFAKFVQTYLLEQNEEQEEDDPEVQEVKAQLLQRLSSITSEDDDDGIDQEATKTSEDKGSSPSKTKGKNKKKLSRGISIKEEIETMEKKEDSKPAAMLIEEEKTEIGSVKFSALLKYAKALGLFYFGICMLFDTLYHASLIGSNIWISMWTEDSTLTNRSLPADSTVYRDKNDFYLGIYGTLGIVQVIFVLLSTLIFSLRTVAASRHLHENMIHAVVRSPMSFFDTTPIGRIVNRFSDDLETLDLKLSDTLDYCADAALVVLSTLVVISYSTPFFMTIIIPLGILYFLFQRLYIPTSRQLIRLESKTRSPIYNHFGETLAGTSVIRAYSVQSAFIVESHDRVDINQQYSFASLTVNRWLAVRLEFIGNVIILGASLFAVIESGNISGGLVGLSISYAQQITENLSQLVKMSSNLETDLVAVERINEYIKKPVEPELINQHHRPHPAWPQNGQIQFQRYSTRYREGLDLVLKNIEAIITPGQKVGIVGRTGAGKSSLTLALFRLIEPAGGYIEMDGENISHLGLHDLRSKITILPQEPVLFSGTLRMNLDPVDAYTDDEIWRALEHAHLKSHIQSLPSELEYDCGEGGQNLSVGQRQLLCLARSLLRKTKVLILDEATAAVDMQTDELIQQTIRTEFSDCTVLTIAHRLNTVMDYDRIMVLDQGEVKELDRPNVLLKNPESLFYQLAKDAGLV